MKPADLDDAKIQADYLAGVSIQRLARLNDVATDTISRRLRLAGIPIRVFQKRFGPETIREIRAEAASGTPQRVLARKYDVTCHAMWKIIHEKSYPVEVHSQTGCT